LVYREKKGAGDKGKKDAGDGLLDPSKATGKKQSKVLMGVSGLVVRISDS